MPNFIYKATKANGKKTKGTLEANNLEDAKKVLTERGYKKFTINKSLEINIKFLEPGIELRDKTLFTRTFVTMLQAGLPIIQGLDILVQQQTKPPMKRVIKSVKNSVEQGSTLADAMRQHPTLFDDLYCNLVEAGETGGVLDTVLLRLATYYEKQELIVKKVKSAMTYPLITLGAAVGAVAIMLIKVIPVFEKMFKDMGGELPGPTQFVIDISHTLGDIWPFILGTIAGLYAILKALQKNEKTARMLDLVLLQLPLFGPLVLLGGMARFSQTLGTLLSSGVPIIDALTIGERVVGNRVLAEEIHEAKQGIEQGKTFTEPLRDSEYFPQLALQMIEIGETTGQLDVMLEKVSKYFEEEVDSAVETLSAAAEPIIMVFVAIAVGGLLIAMYMPIFSIAGSVK